MLERKTKRSDIRFINSHYQDLFYIPDGGFIHMQKSSEEITSRKCTFVDEYHTHVGFQIFHIREFAEIMERNGTRYQPEPETFEKEPAWKAGKDRFLAVQVCEDGYDYTVFDENLREIDGGQIDNTEKSMNEIRNEILEEFQMDQRELKSVNYGELMERTLDSDMNKIHQTQMVDTSRGKMPIEDYREIIAIQNGFDSYKDMYIHGFRIGKGMDQDPDKESCDKYNRKAGDTDDIKKAAKT